MNISILFSFFVVNNVVTMNIHIYLFLYTGENFHQVKFLHMKLLDQEVRMFTKLMVIV